MPRERAIHGGDVTSRPGRIEHGAELRRCLRQYDGLDPRRRQRDIAGWAGTRRTSGRSIGFQPASRSRRALFRTSAIIVISATVNRGVHQLVHAVAPCQRVHVSVLMNEKSCSSSARAAASARNR
jgi:hypothetical protein